MRLSILFLFAFLISSFSFSQGNESKLREKELELSQLLAELRSVKEDAKIDDLNAEFKKEFKRALLIDGAFDYPFESLRTVGKIHSQDKLVRVITWNVQYENLAFNYSSFIMKKDERRNKVYVTELNRQQQPYSMIEGESVTDENWYGALYYDIIDVKRRSRTFYTLLGYDANNQSSSIKLIDVLYFTGSKPNFGYPLFNTKNGRARRVIFEHSAKATMSLKYDDKREKIIFDHLTPESPNLKEFRSYYIPDMSYDAFNWDGKQWNLEEDIIAINKEESDRVELKAYDSKLDTVVTVPVKKKWINPEDPNSAVSGGKHQAITPEDIEEGNSKKNKKKRKKEKKRKSSYPPSNIGRP
ncbi:hypothetical protein [Brumimicrobium aurantiacum]|uniref:Outer membrane lipoprotein-sorting protein n=1 Tax=Brumimicrobium aurantiacum TaxID=1737063 RepID=A0A3E1F0H9_9FLAO|nr:hypothetical protein [Brumimicrobium aurantiacum]RFC55217.1 hypothetical protein DXU93_05190 [Brumimicrobium aurantiacum]